MTDRPAPSDHLLGLLSQKAVHQVLRLLATRDGSTTFRAIGAPNAERVLRSLATEGFVRRTGSWDIAPTPDTPFELTQRGWKLITQLDRLEEWSRERSRRRSP